MLYADLTQKITQWAGDRKDIRLAVVIGSRARVEKPADMWSDLDLLLFTTNPEIYLLDASWLQELGVYHVTFLEPTAVGEFVERRVLFDAGIDVDFVPFPMNVLEGNLLPELSGVLQRGFRVLVDKDAWSSNLASLVHNEQPDTRIYQLPKEEAFLQLVNDFLYHAVWTAKKLCRGELWTAKMCCDGYMKRQLLQMAEWNHQAIQDGVDTWHEGRFFDSWADPTMLTELRKSFAVYDVDSVWKAVMGTVDIFERLSQAFAGCLAYEYPSDTHEYVVELLRRYRAHSDMSEE